MCACVVGAEALRPLWPKVADRPLLDLCLRPLVYVLCIYAVLTLSPFDAQVFVYFQF